MSFLETVTIEFGAAIAKSILKLWLRDSSLGEDISSSLVDLLKSRTSDLLALRRGQRQFDAIGEKVGENLLPLFEIEGAHLDEGSRIAVARAVADTFNKSKLSSDLLAERNLDPIKLANYVLTSNTASTQIFSRDEKDFYERIIAESCTCIVDVASQLPSFSEHTFAEILKREDRLLARADQILQEFIILRERLDPTVESGRYEMVYRQAIARNMDVLQLLGTDVSTPNRRHRLSVAYITLSVEQVSTHTKKMFQSNIQTEQIRDIVTVDKALANSQNLFISGAAGSGKTTLLQWIAVRSATRSFEGHLVKWNDSIPFYIRLRHCVESGLPRPEGFPGLVAPTIADTMPKGWVHAVLKSGHAIILIDGLDEVPASRREEIRVWLDELMVIYPKARFIITSRPHALEEGWLDHSEISYAELQPMQLSDIYTFIDHWHNAVREELHEDEEKAKLGFLAEHLKDDLRHNRSIRSLATSPLLCAMLCALNRDREQQLPSDRIELYEACCSLLIERRDKARNVNLTDFPVLTYRQKSVLLEDLAYWLIKNGWTEVELRYCDARFEHKLKNMSGISPATAGSDVRRFFLERTGIIREPIENQIDFTHRTFQEFLAAKAILDEMDMGVLVKNAHNDQWREVTILACGLAVKPLREKLILDLIARGDREKEHLYQLHLLALSCLEMSVELGQEVRKQVEQHIGKLVPPQNTADSISLASAGDLAVGYLANGNYSGKISAACVHALALIGSDAALEMIEEYAIDQRSIVVDELVRAWDNFDREIYVSRILSKTFRNKFDLRFERLPSLQGFQHFTKAISLTLSNCPHIGDLGPLASLKQLAVLELTDCSQLKDINPLSSLTQLAMLDLSGCYRIDDYSPLLNLAQLTSLNLTNWSQLDHFYLADLAQLTSLNLSRCSKLSVLKLVGLMQLTSLNLSNCFNLSTLDLVGLNRLKLLTLTGQRSHLSTLNLAGLTQLTSLDLSGCFHLSTLNLAGLTQLTSLDLTNNAHCRDLSFLTSLTRLTSLNLTGCSQFIDQNLLADLNNRYELIIDRRIDSDQTTAY